MEPLIKTSAEKKLIGKRLTMSFANYKVGELWGSFIPKRREISDTLSSDMISMAIYSPSHFSSFDPSRTFEKWATVEVSNFNKIPDTMEMFTLPAGLYAVFYYTGSSTDHSIFDYIFKTWIPNSEYTLDDRPHFEVLGSKYKNNDPTSEEEIWIPIKIK